MSFHEVRFPTNISRGSVSSPGFNTAIIETSGAEERTARQEAARRTFDARWGIKSRADMANVISFYMARRGALHGFRWKDWSDYTTASDHFGAHSPTDQVIGAGDGVTTTFQLRKVYSDAGGSLARNLVKPVSGTVRVAVNGSEVLSGWSVSTVTGIVTFTSAPAMSDVITAGCEFDVPVRFDRSADEAMKVSLDSFDERSLPAIPLVEERDPSEADEDFLFRGARQWGTVSANFSITEIDGAAHACTPSGGGFAITLPDYATLAPGGPKFYIFNESATNAIAVKNHLGSTVVTIAALGAAILCLAADSIGAKKWYAV